MYIGELHPSTAERREMTMATEYRGYIDQNGFFTSTENKPLKVSGKVNVIVKLIEEPVDKELISNQKKAIKNFFQKVRSSDEDISDDLDEFLKNNRFNISRELDL